MKSQTETQEVSTTKTESKKNYFKKKKEKLKEKKDKKVKLIVNLTKCSQNWSKIANDLPKPVFKRQSLKKTSVQEQPKVEIKTTEPANKIWFEVDKTFLPEDKPTNKKVELSITETETTTEKRLTKELAMDCEMVGVGENGKDSILARISIVNHFNECIYDKYVLPTETVTDYRTSVSGIRPSDIKKSNNAIPLTLVQKEVSDLLEDRILVGHAIHNDLKVLFLSHPKKKIRDTQKCKVFRQKYPSLGSLSSLKTLAKVLLGLSIQEGEHNSVHDAQTAMMLYTTYKKEWEAYLRDKKLEAKKSNLGQASTSVIKNGAYTNSEVQITTGNDNHKKYLQNKLKKRQRFTKKFIK